MAQRARTSEFANERTTYWLGRMIFQLARLCVLAGRSFVQRELVCFAARHVELRLGSWLGAQTIFEGRLLH